jgi:putative flippase GtrA
MIRRQAIRFIVIGLGLNGALYGAYILLTHTLMGSRNAMTITYCCGALTGFLLNRSITFDFHGRNCRALLHYAAACIIGYAINFAVLWVFVDRLGMAHEIVQGGSIALVASLTFFLQRYWVFAAETRSLPALQVGSGP